MPLRNLGCSKWAVKDAECRRTESTSTRWPRLAPPPAEDPDIAAEAAARAAAVAIADEGDTDMDGDDDATEEKEEEEVVVAVGVGVSVGVGVRVGDGVIVGVEVFVARKGMSTGRSTPEQPVKTVTRIHNNPRYFFIANLPGLSRLRIGFVVTVAVTTSRNFDLLGLSDS